MTDKTNVFYQTSSKNIADKEKPNVASAFENKVILVTGASGFLGKVLVEKLLYSLPKIKNIYLLIRSHKGKSPDERLQKILQSSIFKRIQCTNHSLLSKLVPINGDLMKPELGLCESDIQKIIENVSIVFHCAASVKFDEPLRVSIQMNVIGTQKLMRLCQKMKRLVCVVHASTAYANCNLTQIEEKIYTPNVEPNKLIEASNWMNESMLDTLAPQLLNNRPNTYTYAKAIAESQLMIDANNLPLIIVRPSIIGAMWKEPLPGWTDNVNGPTGLFVAVGKGILTNMCGNLKANADIIPVDIVSNALIVSAAYKIHLDAKKLQNKTTEIIPIIHCCSGTLNPLKWERIVIYLEQFFNKFPLDECMRIPSTQFHSNRLHFLFYFYLKHYYPAYVIDFALKLMKRNEKFVKIYKKVWRMTETLHYFTKRGWQFESKNILNLWNSLTEEDQKTYNFDVRQVNWDCYLFDYLMGLKLYLLREELKNLPKAQTNLSRIRHFYMYKNMILWFIAVKLFARRRTKKQKWIVWLIGCSCSYVLQNFNWRPKVYLKTLEEYNKTAYPVYS